jgi:mono/diheme cytochrome c family protein
MSSEEICNEVKHGRSLVFHAQRMASLVAFLLMAVITFSAFTVKQDNRWVAPSSADSLINPQSNNPKAAVDGKKLYEKHCWQCHGMSGKGDGPGSKALNPKPADHTSALVQDQTDGALYWKITKGRGAMQTYERTLTAQQRWQLVVYIRTLDASK